jgi:hypothetical protein
MDSATKIYLSEQRGCTQSKEHRSFHTFNFGDYQQQSRQPFKNLVAFNDETLLPKASVIYPVTDDLLVFLLPVIGGIQYKLDGGLNQFVEVGESSLLNVKKNSWIEISNLYQEEPVNFICVWLTDASQGSLPIHSTFELDAAKNSLITLVSSGNIFCRIGKFASRTDFQVKLNRHTFGLFAFVIEGAFEFQHVLLQQRDGLSIENISEIEFEALSNEAIILIFEL